MVEHEESSTPVVTAAVLRSAYAPCLAFALSVIVALFVQKSDGNSSLVTLTYMGVATVSVLAIWSAVVAVRLRGRPHDHRFAGYHRHPARVAIGAMAGVVGLVTALVGIDAEDSDFGVLPSGDRIVLPSAGRDQHPPLSSSASMPERVHDSEELAVRNVLVASNSDHIRVMATVSNKTKATVVADQASVGLHLQRPTGCTGDFPPIYKVDDSLTVNAQGATGSVTMDGGPLDGFSVPASGRLVLDCADTELTLGFKIAVTLPPLQSSYLVIEVPRRLHAVLQDVIEYKPDPSRTFPIGAPTDLDLDVRFPPATSTQLDVTVGLGHTSSTDKWACVKQAFGDALLRLLEEPCKT